MTNRSEINRALAKALAYAECGKFEEAQRWGEVLIRKLELASVFKAGQVRVESEHNPNAGLVPAYPKGRW